MCEIKRLYRPAVHQFTTNEKANQSLSTMNGKQTNSEIGHHKLGIILHLCGYKCLKIPWNVHPNMATLIGNGMPYA
jgi:hypothetical protein